MPSGTSSNPCCWFPPNEVRSTGPTCATSSTRCSTSRTLGASGASCLTSSDPGPGSGLSFVGGRGTERGPGFSLHFTRRRAPLLAERNRDPRWWSSTPTSREEPRTGVSPSTTKVAPMVGPTGPSASSAWTSRGCRSACELFPPRRPRPAPSNRYSTTWPTGADERLELVLVDRGTAQSAATRMPANVQLRGPPGRVGRTTSQRARGQDLSPHSSRLARRSGPRTSRATSPPGALLREHRDLGHRMVARRLNHRGPSSAVLNFPFSRRLTLPPACREAST